MPESGPTLKEYALSVDTQSSVIRRPADVAAMLPSLVGFTPQMCLVIVCVKDDAVLVTIRLDLPDDWSDLGDGLLATFERVGAEKVLLIVCARRGSGDLPFATHMSDLISTWCDAGVAVLDALLIDTDRYWSYLCHTDACCDIDGTHFAFRDALAASQRREDVVRAFDLSPDQTPSQEAYTAVLGALEGACRIRADRAWDAVTRLAEGSRQEGNKCGDPKLHATLHLLLQDVRVRDFVLTQIALAPTPKLLVDAVVEAALTAPAELLPRVAGAAAALLAAVEASSIPATCLAQHAGDDSLADLVLRSIASGVAPSALRELLKSSLPEVERQLDEVTA